MFIFAPLFVNGQETFDYKAFEAKVKKHIYSSPDSTRVIIDEVLAKKNLHDTIRGLVYNIYGIYYSHIGELDSSMASYKKSAALLKNHLWIKTMPLMNMSIGYRNRGEYAESFKCLEEALEINKTLGLKDKEATVYSNMSSNYQYMLEYDKAVEYALKGIEIMKKEDSPLLATLTQKLANTYMKMSNFSFAKELYEDCLRIFRKQNDNVNYTLTLINYAEVLIHLNQNKKAKEALKEAIGELRKLKNPEHLAIAYSKLGRIAKDEHNTKDAYKNYEAAFGILSESNSINVVIIGAEYIELLNKNEDYDKALKVIEKTKHTAIFNNANKADKMRFDVAMAETYSKTDNEKEALAGLVRALKIKDSLARSGTETYTKEMQAKYQAELQREKSMALKAKNGGLQKAHEAEKTRMVVYITISLAIILLVLLLLRSYWLRERLRKEALRFAATEKNILQKQHEYEKELTQAQKDIIAEKERELASSALKMANYQDNILQIIERCGTDSINKVSDVKKELEGLIKQKDYWRQFETRFNMLHPDFGTSLANRYSNLTKNDIEFCSLLKLNLSNKEIAQLLQISHESAITKKYRIKKKMEIHTDEDFEKLLLEM
ncbi:tetratricopeptide repeat protein [Flavobacterium sp. DGU11]|uniref:Tetratricopeptide repeat protein n=1 Tax=Flavobacterium arundinis TaxID=3139143 RepID=A0ABU9HYC4_9FLAO